jgi:hypothetical protein
MGATAGVGMKKKKAAYPFSERSAIVWQPSECAR